MVLINTMSDRQYSMALCGYLIFLQHCTVKLFLKKKALRLVCMKTLWMKRTTCKVFIVLLHKTPLPYPNKCYMLVRANIHDQHF